MPMMPTQPSTAPAAMAEAAVDADAPEGAFEEMLARRLGRQLVGRFAREQGDGAESGLDGEPMPWMPPSAGTHTSETMPTETAPGLVSDPDVLSDPSVVRPAPTIEPLRTDPIVGAPEPTPVRISVNRPGFPAPMAEPGIIQPGPNGEVWTHPSGFADLQLTRGQATTQAGALPAPTSRLTPEVSAESPTGLVLDPTAPTTDAPEPPVVRWSPAPARAALAAAANRDLELEIVTKMAQQAQQPTSQPRLRVVESPSIDAATPVPPTVAFDPAAAPLDGAVSTAAPTTSGLAPANMPNAALVERVMNAVEMQQHLPPPRAIAIEIPEIEGLRLLVTMRMDGTVHVASSGTTSQVTDEQVTPLLQAVNDALTERGFDMSADTGGRQSARQDADDEPTQPRMQRFRRSARRTGLRI